jgi:outer membrane protein assembly factor BamB
VLVLQARERDAKTYFDKPADCMTCAFDTADGAERWRYAWRGVAPNVGDAQLVSAVFDDTTVYCRVSDDEVVALARVDGAVRWQFPLGSPVDQLMFIAPGMLGVGTNGQVFALSAVDGSRRWHFRDSRDGIWMEHMSERRAILPITDLTRDGDRLLMAINYDTTDSDKADPNRAGVLVALRPDEGALLWRINADKGARPLLAPGSPVIGFVPVDPYQAYIGALAADDGRELWRRKTSAASGEIRGRRHGDALYTFIGKALIALAAADGAELWSYPLANLDPAIQPPYYYPLSVVIG